MRDKTNYLHHVVLERQLFLCKIYTTCSTKSSTITRPSSVVSFFRKYTVRGQKVFLSVVQRPIPSGIRNSLFAAQTMRRYGFARWDSCSCSKGRVHRFYIYPKPYALWEAQAATFLICSFRGFVAAFEQCIF